MLQHRQQIGKRDRRPGAVKASARQARLPPGSMPATAAHRCPARSGFQSHRHRLKLPAASAGRDSRAKMLRHSAMAGTDPSPSRRVSNRERRWPQSLASIASLGSIAAGLIAASSDALASTTRCSRARSSPALTENSDVSSAASGAMVSSAAFSSLLAQREIEFFPYSIEHQRDVFTQSDPCA